METLCGTVEQKDYIEGMEMSWVEKWYSQTLGECFQDLGQRFQSDTIFTVSASIALS